MRLWHLIAAVLFVALALAVVRDEAGRVALGVFFVALMEVGLGRTALMLLFRSVAQIGYARRPTAHVEAVAATALIAFIAALAMNAVFWVGCWIVQHLVFF